MSLSKQALRDLLLQDLAAALNALREALPEHTEKHNVVLALLGRLKAINKEHMLGTLDMDGYTRHLNTVRASALELIGGLEPPDFGQPAATNDKPGGKPAPKQGSVLYRVPQQMPLQKPSICTVRVAIEEDALFEDMVMDEHVRLRRRVQVSDMMQAELLDPEGEVFAIRPLSAKEQLVGEVGYTQWLFHVTPRTAGEHQLLIRVSMMEYVPNLGRYVPKEVSILETVTIVTEQAAPADDAPPPFKATGEVFALGPTPGGTKGAEQAPPQQGGNRGLRALALFLAFLVVAPGATWALAPVPVRDFWKAEWQGTPEAYAAYVAAYKDDATALARTRVEKARYLKAERTMDLTDLREYQANYPAGEYIEDVLKKIAILERLNMTSSANLNDSDADGAPDTADGCPQDKNKTAAGICGCGNPDTDSDADGTPDCKDGCPQDKNKTAAGVCGCGTADVDTDADGTPDCKDGCPQDKNKTAAGVCGCGTADTDSDADGTPDCKDGCPQDKNKTVAGTCGCGKPDTDSDADGIPDCQDDCPREKGSAARKGCPDPKPAPEDKTKTPDHNRRSGLEMVPVRGGTFMMGSPDSDKDAGDAEKPQHEVTVAAFQIGKYEVTQADWKEIMGNNPSKFKNCDQCPVENISWDDIQDFLKKLNQKYPDKNYRLPTEAEWEYAARGGAGAKKTKYAGSDDLGKVAWYSDNSGDEIHPVGEKAPNALGLYDMSGNVWEWCQDVWHDNYQNAPRNGKAWMTGGDQAGRVLRGGSWYNSDYYCCPAVRGGYNSTLRNAINGFRLAQD